MILDDFLSCSVAATKTKVVNSEADINLPKDQKVYFRYTFRNFGNGTHDFCIELWPVIKETPKGVWVGDEYDKHFVLNDARKKFASPTIAEAKASFMARKNRQIRILSGQISNAKLGLALATSGAPVSVWTHRCAYIPFKD